tara:strand:+ start:786 stop:1457 length:672 start_codon:yes stop_codon:yes gene_type:complete
MHHRFSLARRRFAAVVFGGVSPPGVGWGARLDVGRKKNACDWYEKRLFVSFCKKKNHKKKGQKRDILRPKRRVFSTPNTKARRTTNQKTTTGQKRERTTTFQTRIIERAADSFENPSRVVVSRLFFVGEIFQFRIGSRVKSKKEEQRGERRRDGQRSSRASTREGALRFPVFLRFVVGSHRRGRSPVPRIRPPRDFFEMPCENVLCNQSIGSPKRHPKEKRRL